VIAPTDRPLPILFAASEAQPLIKTGGLADVAGSLPQALRALGQDARLILPAYTEALERAGSLQRLSELKLPGSGLPVRLLGGQLVSGVPFYLVDAPGAFQRPGNPYQGPDGRDWGDNADRYALFCRAIVELAMGRAGLDWRPRLVHANDWQTGLAAPLLALEDDRPANLFTIHNLAYQGLFDQSNFERLALPSRLWSLHGLEFYEMLSYLKGGIAFSDLVTTVSPTYAEEIQTAEFGYGLQGLLGHLEDRLVGVLNGVDYDYWNPGTDPAIPSHYGVASFEAKQGNKTALQQELGLPENADAMVFGHVGRLVEQKGVDLILTVLPGIMERPNTQVVVLGSGDAYLEQRLRDASARYPGRIGLHIGYNEGLAHRIEAGSDSFLMPSRFEPCGLNQLYSLRYGTPPIVRRTGGLADTVVDATPENLANGSATGFVFEHANAAGLWYAVEHALALWHHADGRWRQIAVAGMEQDFSWDNSAARYLELYRRALANPLPNPLAA
jgi:starch synthase